MKNIIGKGVDRSIAERFVTNHGSYLARVITEVEMGLRDDFWFGAGMLKALEEKKVFLASLLVTEYFCRLETVFMVIDPGQIISESIGLMDEKLPIDVGAEIMACLARKWGADFVACIPPERVTMEMREAAEAHGRSEKPLRIGEFDFSTLGR